MTRDFCEIPVVGHMVKGLDGKYHLDKAASTWANIPANVVAKFLVDRCGADAVFGGSEAYH